MLISPSNSSKVSSSRLIVLSSIGEFSLVVGIKEGGCGGGAGMMLFLEDDVKEGVELAPVRGLQLEIFLDVLSISCKASLLIVVAEAWPFGDGKVDKSSTCQRAISLASSSAIEPI